MEVSLLKQGLVSMELEHHVDIQTLESPRQKQVGDPALRSSTIFIRLLCTQSTESARGDPVGPKPSTAEATQLTTHETDLQETVQSAVPAAAPLHASQKTMVSESPPKRQQNHTSYLSFAGSQAC